MGDFESLMVGDVITAHGEQWFRIQHLCDDLDQGRRLYLAARLDAVPPAATFVVAEPIAEAELERLRTDRAAREVQFAAFRSRSK